LHSAENISPAGTKTSLIMQSNGKNATSTRWFIIILVYSTAVENKNERKWGGNGEKWKGGRDNISYQD